MPPSGRARIMDGAAIDAGRGETVRLWIDDTSALAWIGISTSVPSTPW